MFRTLIRVAPVAMMGYRWWQRRKSTQGESGIPADRRQRRR